MIRTIILGDIHGCHDEFMELLDKVHWDPEQDYLVSLGDLTDRGPKSAEVVRWIREHNQKYPASVNCVIGNHDDKHVRYYKHMLKKREHPNYTIPIREFSLDKIQVFNSLSDEDLEWMSTLPAFILKNNTVFVHAGLEPRKTLEEQDPRKITHIRFYDKETLRPVSLDRNHLPPENSIYWTEIYNLPFNVVYGHHVHSLEKPRVTERPNGTVLIGIDTGVPFGGCLTALVIPEHGLSRMKDYEFVQVKARKTYRQNFVLR